jgi:mannose-6-phosphate isomerase-like protein (cupin superfamily)
LTRSWHCDMSDEQEGVPLLVISRENAEHYVWGDSCDGWHLVRDSDLSVIEECMPAGTSEVSHCHRRSRQFFFILSGRAVMETDGVHIPLCAGQGLQAPPGAYHRFCNESDEPVRFLVVSHPPSHGDRVMDVKKS